VKIADYDETQMQILEAVETAVREIFSDEFGYEVTEEDIQSFRDELDTREKTCFGCGAIVMCPLFRDLIDALGAYGEALHKMGLEETKELIKEVKFNDGKAAVTFRAAANLMNRIMENGAKTNERDT
jgi:hypothetical protein